MNKSILIGVIFTNAVFLYTAYLALGSLKRLYDYHSIVLVLGGTLGMVIFSFPFRELRLTFKESLRGIFSIPHRSRLEIIQEIVSLSKAKRKGDAAFDGAVQSLKDAFIKDAASILFWADAEVSPEDFRNLLETKASALYENKMTTPRTLKGITKFPPALGMMGTILGLVGMLYSMSDPAAKANMGSSFAVALMATLYGIMCNNLVLFPLAENITVYIKEEFSTNIMIVEGIMMIQARRPTKYVEEKLLSFLPAEEKGKSIAS